VREGGVDDQVVLDDLDAQFGIDEREQLEPGCGQERVRVGPERPLAGERARQPGGPLAEARLHQRGLARRSGTFDLAGEGAEAVGVDLGGDDDPQAGRGGQRRSDRSLLAVLGRKCDREPEGGVVIPHPSSPGRRPGLRATAGRVADGSRSCAASSPAT
jgi:hypothetical protein